MITATPCGDYGDYALVRVDGEMLGDLIVNLDGELDFWPNERVVLSRHDMAAIIKIMVKNEPSTLNHLG